MPTDGTRTANMGDRGLRYVAGFSGNSRTSHCLPVSKHLGCRNVKHNGRLSHYADEEVVSLAPASSPALAAEIAAAPAANS